MSKQRSPAGEPEDSGGAEEKLTREWIDGPTGLSHPSQSKQTRTHTLTHTALINCM